MKIFNDYEAGGALCTLLSTCFLFKYTEGWKRFEFTNPEKRENNLKCFEMIETELLKTGHLIRPNVFLSNRISVATTNELKRIIESHGGKTIGVASKATHIVEPDPLEGKEDDLDYLRTLQRRNAECLVHWWYYPDSYDNWIPSSEVEGEDTEPEEQHIGVWTITSRWISDTHFFNEWMNEIDYEITPEEIQAAVKPKAPKKNSRPKKIRRSCRYHVDRRRSQEKH
eukprot:TRINITY_DN5058_c0_g1_i1.p1 TRINITY_DN5058_c0_g1~~TRINITY_DN5058_c0_g1_i1.p1  ORF type:complete len:263 (+),score=59.20 TRINITY_DN5058_c0_g1_i1:114-791(+)